MDYSELQLLVQDTLQRGDVAPAVPSWIQLAEARFNRELRVQQMVVRAYANLNESFIELPEDWLEALNVELHTEPPRPLEFITLQEADKVRARSERVARYYVIHGKELEVVPYVAEPTDIEMTYYKKVPSLTTEEPSNWLLASWPDLYLYETLRHSAPFLEHDNRMGMWDAAVARMMEEIRLADAKAQHSGSPLRIRARPFN